MTQNKMPTLYAVTLDWNPNNREEGKYSANVWTTSHEAAIRMVAEEMADHPDSEVTEGDDARREEFIGNIIDGAGQFAAESVAQNLMAHFREFLAGPTCEMSSQAESDF